MFYSRHFYQAVSDTDSANTANLGTPLRRSMIYVKFKGVYNKSSFLL